MKVAKKEHEVFILEFRFKALVDVKINHVQQTTESSLRFIGDGSPATQSIVQFAETLRELEESSASSNERLRSRAKKTAKHLYTDIVNRLQFLLKNRTGLSIKKEDGTYTELNTHEFMDFPAQLGKIKEARFVLIRHNPLLTPNSSEIVFGVNIVPLLML